MTLSAWTLRGVVVLNCVSIVNDLVDRYHIWTATTFKKKRVRSTLMGIGGKKFDRIYELGRGWIISGARCHCGRHSVAPGTGQAGPRTMLIAGEATGWASPNILVSN